MFASAVNNRSLSRISSHRSVVPCAKEPETSNVRNSIRQRGNLAMIATQDSMLAKPITDEAAKSGHVPASTEKVKLGSDSSDSESTTRDSELELASKEDAKRPPRNMKGITWILVVISILSSLFFFSLDNTIVAVVQPQIIGRFNALDKLPWLVVAYVLGSVSMALFWGRLYTLFDGKILYIVGLSLFEAGSALCGAAPTMDILIVGRTLCGVGGAGMYIGVLSLLSAFTTERERPMYIGMTGLVWGLGTALGPIIGGIFADSSAGWRWAFYINLVIGGLCAPVYIFLLPASKPRPNESSTALWKTLDWVGAVLSIGAFVTGTMAMGFGGIIYPWSSGPVISLFVISGLLFIAFGVQQTKAWFTTRELRLFPVQFVLNKDLCILFASIGAGTALIFLPIYFLPLYFQYVHGVSALASGVKMVPFIVTMVFFVFVNGGFVSKTGIYWPWYTGGSALALIGSALLYTIDINTSDAKIYSYTVLAGIGTGCFVQSSFAVGQALVKPSEVGWATGFITVGQLSAGTISMSISNSLFLNKATRDVMSLLPGSTAAQVQAGIAGVGDFLKNIPASKKDAVNAALVKSINQAWILSMAAASLVLVLSLFLKRKKLFMDVAIGA